MAVLGRPRHVAVAWHVEHWGGGEIKSLYRKGTSLAELLRHKSRKINIKYE